MIFPPYGLGEPSPYDLRYGSFQDPVRKYSREDPFSPASQRLEHPLLWTNFPLPHQPSNVTIPDEVHSRTLRSLHQNIRNSLSTAANLQPEHRTRYHQAMTDVLGRMPRLAIARIHHHTKKGGFFFHPTTAHVHMALAQEYPELFGNWQDPKGYGKTIVAGAYDKRQRRLYLDGGTFLDNEQKDTSHVYAHELGHAIDGPQNRHSLSARWQRIWKEEMKGGQLTKYAATMPSEGFAEFSRLLYGNNSLPIEEIQSRFPKAFKYWKDHQLWERPVTTATRPSRTSSTTPTRRKMVST